MGSLSEPNAWTLGFVLATSVVLIARHPLARAIGTETAGHDVVATPAPARAHTLTGAPSLSAPVAAVATHAPRDPFRALVTAGGKVLAPVEVSANGTVTTSAPTPASCVGASHRVVAGDTLWSLAARAVRSSDTGRVTLAWHRLYAANRAVVGSDPGVLRIGRLLCLPTSL